MVAREDNPNHWQIPQGGTDGEDLKTAGIREIGEELKINSNNLIVKGVWKNLYKYGTFLKAGYRGQKQGLVIAQYLGNDEEISVDFFDHVAWKWVKKSEFLSTAHPVRRESYETYLKKLTEII
jgi:8-oxo-dGTP pyrophosphatase MutT (NUDIX family)